MSATPAQERRYARSAVVTAVLQIGTMVVGGLLAVLVSHLFGKGARTDGLFAAYGVYTMLLGLAQTLRTTIVARLAGGELGEEYDRLLGSVLLLALGFAVPLVVLAEPLAKALTGDLGTPAVDAASTALAVLWFAALAQLIAALSAAALAVRGEFGLPGAAYVGGGVLGLVVLEALHGSLGIDAVAVGVAAGSAATALVLLARMLMLGWRPHVAAMRPGGGTFAGVKTVLLGAVSSMLGQLSYLVTVGFAARVGEGAVTVYTYAFFVAALLMGATSMPAGIVMAAPIVEDWDRRPASLRTDTLAVARFGFVLMVPVLAAAVAFGADLAQTVLGDAITASDADVMVQTFVILGAPVAAALIVAVPLLAAFAANRYGAVAGAAGVAVIVHVAATAVASLADTVQALAVAGAASSLTWAILIYVVILHDEAWRMAAAMGRELVVAAGLGLLAFGPPLAAAALAGGVVAGVAAWLVGLALFVAVLHRSRPHWDLVARVLEPLRAKAAGRSATRVLGTQA
jgi:peptidoglycan biosynthesis protein MviN/MurJ (putative lipid II flippase)